MYRRLFGDVSIEQRKTSLRTISDDRRFDSLRYAITDYLDVVSYEASAESTVEMAAMHIGPLFTNPRLLIVAVVNRPDILACIHEFMRFEFIKAPYRAFSTMPEARAWISEQLR